MTVLVERRQIVRRVWSIFGPRYSMVKVDGVFGLEPDATTSTPIVLPLGDRQFILGYGFAGYAPLVALGPVISQGGIEGAAASTDLHPAGDLGIPWVAECFGCRPKHPLARSHRLPVAAHDPAVRLVRVTPFGPLPELVPEVVSDVVKSS
jgi:hypothetical protein